MFILYMISNFHTTPQAATINIYLTHNLFISSSEAEYKYYIISSVSKINLESKKVKYMVSCQYNQSIIDTIKSMMIESISTFL